MIYVDIILSLVASCNEYKLCPFLFGPSVADLPHSGRVRGVNDPIHSEQKHDFPARLRLNVDVHPDATLDFECCKPEDQYGVQSCGDMDMYFGSTNSGESKMGLQDISYPERWSLAVLFPQVLVARRGNSASTGHRMQSCPHPRTSSKFCE